MGNIDVNWMSSFSKNVWKLSNNQIPEESQQNMMIFIKKSYLLIEVEWHIYASVN